MRYLQSTVCSKLVEAHPSILFTFNFDWASMLQMLRTMIANRKSGTITWRDFSVLFGATFSIGLVVVYLFVLLVDPYDVVPFSLPITRPLVDSNQRFMYPQVVRSGLFDSFVVGTSTSRLLDPEILDQEFGGRFVNLAMDAATAWEQKTMANYFFDQVGQPKTMIVGIDFVWCVTDADRDRITARGFPYFLYDNDKWNDFLYLLNARTVEISGRLVGYHLGLYPERSRFDGYQVFIPPDNTYNLEKAQLSIWGNRPRKVPDSNLPPFVLSEQQRTAAVFPALQWLDQILLKAGNAVKVVSFMPVHVAAQPDPTTLGGAYEAECKMRIVDIARNRGAKVIDWRYSSPLTREDFELLGFPSLPAAGSPTHLS